MLEFHDVTGKPRIGACNHFLLLIATNCGYARMEDLGCAVVCARNCGYARMEDLGCAVVYRPLFAKSTLNWARFDTKFVAVRKMLLSALRQGSLGNSV